MQRMHVNRRKLTFTLLALVLGALCVRLGFWQLDRHAQRQEVIEAQTARLGLPPVHLPPTDDAGEHGGAPAIPFDETLEWRRVALRGRWDFEREIVLRNRSLHGSPGVHVVTPFLLEGAEEGPAILVRRGWLPARDGLRADLREGRPAAAEAEVAGIVMPWEPGVGETSPPAYDFDGEEHVALIRLEPAAAEPLLPYRIAPFIVQASGAGAGSAGSRLQPLPLPELDYGPHIFYAIQWFSFAIIAVVGTTIWLRRVDADRTVRSSARSGRSRRARADPERR